MNRILIEEFYNRLNVHVDFQIINDIVMSDNNILRPVIGHAFEFIVADVVLNKLGGKIEEEGGDSDVDLIIIDKYNNKHRTQIKTLLSAGTKVGKSFQVCLHKTHGQEKRPNNLYPITWPCPHCPHEGDAFPEFLIIPHPTDGILIIPKKYIPENDTYPHHFADPATFLWNSEWLNRWDLLGFPEFKGNQLERRSIPNQPILDDICQKVKLTYEELLTVWLKPSNFRMIDMNLKGNLREPALNSFLSFNKFSTTPPLGHYPKYDLFCEGIRIQIKGTSKSKTNPNKNTLGVEVMGSHGNGSIRRYSTNDFDYLGIVIEPNCLNPALGLDMKNYHFCFIPVNDLPLHYRNGYEWNTLDKIYDVAAFEIIKNNNKVFLKPSTNYKKPPIWKDENGNIKHRKPVTFRNSNIYEIDYIPFQKNNQSL